MAKHVEKKEDVKKVKCDCKFLKNSWAVASIVLAILLLVSVGFNIFSGNSVSESKVESILTDWVASQGGSVTIENITDEGSFYTLEVSTASGAGSAFVTKDGKYLIQPVAQLTGAVVDDETAETSDSPASSDVPKSDKPVVELFVMTHCPYGTQAEKGFIPAIQALQNVADMKIRFVHYTMHGEKEDAETLTQVCIREEQSAKYLAYLSEFLKEGNTNASMKAAGVDATAVAKCVSSGKAKEYYAEDSALSKSYGVQGSPTLVINGVQASSGRSASAYASTVCNAFNDEPSECSKELSSQSYSAGFGYESGSATTASC